MTVKFDPELPEPLAPSSKFSISNFISLNQDQIISGISSILLVVSSIFVAKGYISKQNATTVIAHIVALVTIGFQMYTHSMGQKLLSVSRQLGLSVPQLKYELRTSPLMESKSPEQKNILN
jgi:hypothetical protein